MPYGPASGSVASHVSSSVQHTAGTQFTCLRPVTAASGAVCKMRLGSGSDPDLLAHGVCQYRDLSPPPITAVPRSHPRHLVHVHFHSRLKSSPSPKEHIPLKRKAQGHRRRMGPQLPVLFLGGRATSSLFVPQASGFLQGGYEGGHHLSTARALCNSTGHHSHTQYGSPSSCPPPRPIFPPTSPPT